jgi:hypothetical protein
VSLRLAENRPAAPTTELGDNSVSYAHVKGGAQALIDPEYRYELRGAQGGRTYQRMRWSDPHIWGVREAQNLPMLQAQATIEPADPDDPDALAKAALIQRLLIDDFPWRSFLRDSFLDMDYGFAAFEIVWRLEDGETRFRLALRPSSSIQASDVHVKGGAIDHVVQRPTSGGEVTIPGDKLVWFAHAKEGDLFTGRPILRPMYKPWVIKEELEIELPIAIRKLGGVPDMSYAGQLTADERTKLEAAGAAFGLSPDAYFLHSEKVTASLLTGNATVSDILDAIKQRNTELTSVCQAQVFDLGTSNAGSRALGTTLSDLFTNSITADARRRADVINSRGGVIHQAVSYNFPTDDNLPKLVFGAVQAVDLRTFAAALLAYSQANLPEELDEWARREMNMPERSAEQVQMPGDDSDDAQVPKPPAPASNNPTGPGADAAGGSGPQSGAKASEHLHLAERRDPRGVECFVALADVEARFDDAKTAVRVATQRTRDRMVGELATRAAAAQAKGQLAKFAAGSPPMVDKLAADVRGVLADFYEAGRAQVASELQRQRDGQPVAGRIVEARQNGRRAMAEKPKRKPAPLPDPDEALDMQAESMARGIAAATQAAAAQAAARVAAGVPLDPTSFAEAVGRASDDAALRLGASVADVMSLGRATEAAEQATEIEDAVYSAILDGATCEACEPMDGETTTDLVEAAGWAPNPDCMGGDRCRCLVVYEIRQEATREGIATAERREERKALLRLAEATTRLAERPVPAPVVNLAAAEPTQVIVNVPELPAPVVTIAPAEVTVNLPGLKPRRVSRETAFLTDAAGRIVGKTETETEV